MEWWEQIICQLGPLNEDDIVYDEIRIFSECFAFLHNPLPQAQAISEGSRPTFQEGLVPALR